MYNHYMKKHGFSEILISELVPALGCTEPIAVAYASARARDVLGERPERMELVCSGNIVKNVMGVTVPNSGGRRGLPMAAVLGVVGGDASEQLQVLENVTEADIAEADRLVGEGFCRCSLRESTDNLYILARVFCGGRSASVEIRGQHTHITEICLNNEVIFSEAALGASPTVDKSALSVCAILNYANSVDLDEVRDVLERQIEYNTAISREGLKNPYGAEIGRVILETCGMGVESRARASAAAGSDARMSGCAMPVVINSGSGNQGMTASLPVIEYAEELGCTHEKLLRALIVSNLITVHQKRFIGSLSAYCGAVSAACGAVCGIAYLMGGDYKLISATITNCLCTIGGMVCDGAKPSCAAKIAEALNAALFAYRIARSGHMFRTGEGLANDYVEKTIENVGRIGYRGMRGTDEEILSVMLGGSAE